MFLLPDRIGLDNETAQLSIQISGPLNPEMMNVIMARDRINTVEAGEFMAARQNQMTNKFRGLHLDGGKGHAHLKRNTRLFR
jgi:hypothetical protein